MRGGFGSFMLILAAVASQGAAAMSAHAPAVGPCKVVGGEKLPASAGHGVICTEIGRAMARLAPKVRYTVEVKVLSASRLSAVLVVNGRALPEQNLAVSDRELGPGPVRRFAESLAAAAAKQ